MPGRVIFQNVCQGEAPSMAAAFRKSLCRVLQTRQKDENLDSGKPQNDNQFFEQKRNRSGDKSRQILVHEPDEGTVGKHRNACRTLSHQLADNGPVDITTGREKDYPPKTAEFDFWFKSIASSKAAVIENGTSIMISDR